MTGHPRGAPLTTDAFMSRPLPSQSFYRLALHLSRLLSFLFSATFLLESRVAREQRSALMSIRGLSGKLEYIYR